MFFTPKYSVLVSAKAVTFFAMVNVCILGAAGGIGQPLSLLFKTSKYVSNLSLYDIRLGPGVGVDLSHINTNSKSRGYEKDQIEQALTGAQLVVIPAGVPRKPGMTRDDLFNINAGIVKTLVISISKYAPDARILIISNPVNSTVPIAVETLKSLGTFVPGKVMGVTTLDLIRSKTFLGDCIGRDSIDLKSLNDTVTVVGGHSGNTIVPIFRNKKYIRSLKDKNLYKSYVHRVQFGGDEVVKAKSGAGSATLSMAYAGFHFAEIVMKSMHKDELTDLSPEPCFVYLPGIPGGVNFQKKLGTDIKYFSVPVIFKKGIIVGIDDSFLNDTTDEEKQLISTCLRELKSNIVKGEQFVIGKSKL